MKLLKLTFLALFIQVSISSCRNDNEEDFLVDDNVSLTESFGKDSDERSDNIGITDPKDDTIRSGGHLGKIDSISFVEKLR